MPPSNMGRKRRVARKRKYSNKPSKRMVKTIQRVLNKNIENKQAFTSIANTGYSGQVNDATNVVFCLPNVGQGTGEAERIGDQIRAQSLKIEGWITQSLSATYINASRIVCRVMIVQPKLYTDRNEIISNAAGWLAGLLKRGAVETAFTGAIQDLTSPINTDVITCYYDKLFPVTVPALVTASGAVETAYSVKHFAKTFNLRNKLLRYNTIYNGGISPTNWSPVIIMGYCFVNGSVATPATSSVSMSFTSNLIFQDA